MSQGTVAMVCPYDLSIPGGVQGQVMGLARVIAARDWKVIVAAPGNADSESIPGCTMTSLGGVVKIRANGSKAPIGLNVIAARAFARRCEESAVGVVHLHEPLAPVAGWPVMARNRIPMVGTFHRSGIDALSSVAGVALGHLVRRIQEPVAVSQSAAQTAKDTCGVRPEILFNGVDLASSSHVEPWPKKGPTILFLGRDEPRKGRAILLEAARQLDPSITIWMTGDQPGETGNSGATIEFLGQISEEEKQRRLQATDVLCAPSLGGESFGLVLLEGLASGATVVASDIDGYRQALGGHGVLVAPNDPTVLALALRSALISHRGVQKDLITPYLQQWSLEALADHYEAHYNALTASGRSNKGE